MIFSRLASHSRSSHMQWLCSRWQNKNCLSSLPSRIHRRFLNSVQLNSLPKTGESPEWGNLPSGAWAPKRPILWDTLWEVCKQYGQTNFIYVDMTCNIQTTFSLYVDLKAKLSFSLRVSKRSSLTMLTAGTGTRRCGLSVPLSTTATA